MAAGLALVGAGVDARTEGDTRTEGDARADEARAIEGLIGAGDFREALSRCARAYAMPLGRLCMAFTGSQAESEELVQETLLAAFDAFPQYRAEGSVRAWLFGIARRICGRHTELRARREARLRLVHDTRPRPDASELALERERAERARAALSRLKPSEREAVVLRFDAGLSFKEVAIACGIDEAAARKRVSRALVRLRADLGEE
ncbi:RNA polymerase sigma factor [Sorangium sp. So ce590]|uniref:RNA polymerase sigma factor n=1 Tax=Sorangium sp. So ce590 TaxID=3133317 RepID=UPI003F5EBE99